MRRSHPPLADSLRNWIASWGAARSFAAFDFLVGSGYANDYRSYAIPQGAEHWHTFREQAPIEMLAKAQHAMLLEELQATSIEVVERNGVWHVLRNGVSVDTFSREHAEGAARTYAAFWKTPQGYAIRFGKLDQQRFRAATAIDPLADGRWTELSKGVNFWQELQTNARVMSDELVTRPYTRKLYYDYYHSLYPSPESTLSSTEQAISWFYVLRSNMTGYLRSLPTGWNHMNAETVKTVATQFALVQERIKYLAIDNRDVVDTIKRYEKLPGRVFLYLDPPYHGVEHYYPASRTGFDHAGLARVLHTVHSPVALSYYPHPDLDQLYPPEHWRRITWQQHKPSNIGANVRAQELDMATEMLLCNYCAPAVAPSLWELIREEESPAGS